MWPFENVAATFGLKPVYSTAWKNAPIRLYHVYNRDARRSYVGDMTSVNDEMKFGLARSFMGQWTWKSPDYFDAVDPNTGVKCSFNNDKRNKGYWLGEYDLGGENCLPRDRTADFGAGRTPAVCPHTPHEYAGQRADKQDGLPKLIGVQRTMRRIQSRIGIFPSPED